MNLRERGSWVDRDAAVVWHGFTQMAAFAGNEPVIVERAEGRELIDTDGRRYLDAISSLWVTTLGHRVPELDRALADQLERVAHSTLLGNGNTAVVELAEALAAVVPVDRPHFLFASDGAAAVEQALKIAFQYWVNRGVEGRTTYLALGGAYHGDTVGGISLGAGGFGTDVFDPLRFPVLRAPDVAAAADMVAAEAGRLAAVVVEPLVQGAAGMALHDPADLNRLAEATRRAGVLLVCDEIATGFGRTGTLFASTQAGVRPDLMCLGKGLTGGYLPMSATVASGPVFDAFLGEDLSAATFYHGHSYSGNALAAAVALRHLALLQERDVLDNVAARSAQLGDLLDRVIAPLPAVREVRLRGLMGGVELAPAVSPHTPGTAETPRTPGTVGTPHTPGTVGTPHTPGTVGTPHTPGDGVRWGRRVCAAAVRRGVLLRPLGDVVVLMPMLTSTAGEIERIVTVLAEAIVEVTGS